VVNAIVDRMYHSNCNVDGGGSGCSQRRKSTLDNDLSNCDALGSAITSSIFLPDFIAALLV